MIKFQKLEIYELLRDVDTRYRLMNGFRKYLKNEVEKALRLKASLMPRDSMMTTEEDKENE